MFEPASVPGATWQLAVARHEGAGPCLVYLHGLGLASSEDWPRLASTAAFRGRSSFAVDLLGFGLSPRPAEFSYRLEDQAALVAALLSPELGPVALLGHSMGGTIAVLVAERLTSEGRPPLAVLLAEPNLRPEDATLSARAARMSEEAFVEAWPRWVERTRPATFLAGMRKASPEAYHRSARSLVDIGAGALARWVGLNVAKKGYLLGAKSGATSRETARLVAVAGIPVATVARSGHAFAEDHPEDFAAAVSLLLGAE